MDRPVFPVLMGLLVILVNQAPEDHMDRLVNEDLLASAANVAIVVILA